MHYSYEYMRKNSIQEEKYDVEKIKALIKDGFDKHSLVEYTAFLENMEELSKWCEANQKTAFFQYFQDAAIGAYYRFARTKEKAWSNKEDQKLIHRLRTVSYASPVIMPVVSTAVTWLTQGGFVMPENQVYLFGAGAIATVILLLVCIGRIKMCEHDEEERKHNYYETWVRHSMCNSRLQLALNVFLLSERTDTDYEKFIKDTFAILDRNIDQFAVNMCPRGVAPSVKK